MKQIIEIEKIIKDKHTKFMNKKRTPEDSMVCDLLFSVNLVKLSLFNLQRWSTTTQTPIKAYKSILKKILKEQKQLN